ncbi:MAG: diaminopimelate epimerase [Planctomycetota bacterium]|nr:MAG: diaminopimelate epimerase [Planctomycetota bacterium]
MPLPEGALSFAKLEALGNDFVAVEAANAAGLDLFALARAVCDRRRGVGADGLLAIDRAQRPARVEVYNADGSVGGFSGNGARCAALLLAQEREEEQSLAFVMGGAPVEARLAETSQDGRAARVALTLPPARFGPEAVGARRTLLDEQGWEGQLWRAPGLGPCALVDVGNPHLVRVLQAPPDEAQLERFRCDLAPALAAHRAFPASVNVQLAWPAGAAGVWGLAPWERGVGPTPACGSGAMALAAALRRVGLAHGPVEVRMPGGALVVDAAEEAITLTGRAQLRFTGLWPCA